MAEFFEINSQFFVINVFHVYVGLIKKLVFLLVLLLET